MGAQEVRKYRALIDAAAARYSIDPDIVKATIYTEVSRGVIYGKPAEWLGRARTWYPGNIDTSWQELIPGSNVRDPKDNIELTAKLISRIANRLDDPSIENIYSLYNSLSHDRTYVNKETKTTPYFAKMALEAKAWEKDNWSSPEFPSAKDAQREVLPSERHVFDNRFGWWGSSPAGAAITPAPDGSDAFGNRFGNWGTAPAGGLGDARSPVLRELEKYRKSSAPDGSAPTAVHGAPTPAFQPDAVYSPAGDFFGNFPRVSAGTTPAPIAFNVPGPAVGTGAADNFGAAGRRPVGVLGSFIGDSPIVAAEVRPQLHGVSAPGLSNEETAYGDQSGNLPSGPRPVGYPRLRSRVVSPAFPAIMPPDAVPPDPPEPAPLLGIFSGKPMVPLPHEFWGLPKKSGASSNDALFDLLAGLALRNPASIPPDDDPRRFDRDDQMQPWFL
ncbi:hypothetical protein KMZ29_09210 [Bradyrhizobium sediminis]|uniref:Transglycosylase SLT domain-containing protein n=1 Tax=Bradyrhizobium sediminis TaxID=2840469 RepID=A0A975NGQ2_9BRAD|nr:hypothetical protein [Bradyrhizobium sediminis]QWG14808.1 hypothetical protein KMZ29_09210 [Bradyrhizobium sediminis]